MKKFPFPIPLSPDVIRIRRARILTKLLQMDKDFSCIPAKGIEQNTLNTLLHSYDELFLDGCLKPLNIHVTLSSRLTSSAGKFLCVRKPFGRITQAEIRMSSDFLLRLSSGPFELNGLTVDTPQEAFLLVFEHEICHALELLLYGKTSHSARFMILASGLFGHQATRHKLPTRQQEAAQEGLLVGSSASFLYDGIEKTGVITYIGKTATVMVPSVHGTYRDRSGRRYEKYRVPLDKLTKKNLFL